MNDIVNFGIGACGLDRRGFLRNAGLAGGALMGGGLIAACGGSEAGSATSPSAAEPEPSATQPSVAQLNAGHIPSDHYSPLYVAMANGYFADNDIEIRLNDFATGATLIESFASGDLDIGWVGPPSRVAIARGVPIQAVCGCTQGGSGIAVRDNDIQSIGDLAGKRIGVPAIGTIAHLLLMKGLLDAEVTLEDVELLAIPDPTGMSLSLENGEIAGAAYWEPWVTVMESSGARILGTSETLWSGHQCDVLAASTSMIDEKGDVVERVLDSHLRGIAFIESDFEQAVQIVADQLGIDPEIETTAIGNQKFTPEISEERIAEEYELLGLLDIVAPADIPPWDRLVNERLYDLALAQS